MGIGAWEEVPQGDLMIIATPHVGIVLYDWAIHFKVLQPPCNFNIISNRGLPIDRARCDLVEQARALGATKLFFLDSDVKLPPDGLVRLYYHNMPVVAAIYGSKHQTPGVWVEGQEADKKARYTPVDPNSLNSVNLFTHDKIVIGMGSCLIDMKVFDRLEKPYFKWTQGIEDNGISEDFYFCEKLREKDIPIFVDTSIRCGHLDFSELDWIGNRNRLAS